MFCHQLADRTFFLHYVRFFHFHFSFLRKFCISIVGRWAIPACYLKVRSPSRPNYHPRHVPIMLTGENPGRTVALSVPLIPLIETIWTKVGASECSASRPTSAQFRRDFSANVCCAAERIVRESFSGIRDVQLDHRRHTRRRDRWCRCVRRRLAPEKILIRTVSIQRSSLYVKKRISNVITKERAIVSFVALIHDRRFVKKENY